MNQPQFITSRTSNPSCMRNDYAYIIASEKGKDQPYARSKGQTQGRKPSQKERIIVLGLRYHPACERAGQRKQTLVFGRFA